MSAAPLARREREPLPRQVTLASFEGVVPTSVDWRTLGAPAEEPATAK